MKKLKNVLKEQDDSQIKIFEANPDDVFMRSSKTVAKYKTNDPQTLLAQKALILIFQQFQKKEREFQQEFDYKIRIPYYFFKKIINPESQSRSDDWQKIIRKVLSTSILMPTVDELGGGVNSYIPIFQQIDDGYDNKFVEILLNRQFIPHYTNLARNYVQTNLNDIKEFKSKFSLRIYEFLIASSGSNSLLNLKMDLQEFIQHFNISKELAFPSRIKTSILDPILGDLKTTKRFKNLKIEIFKNIINFESGKKSAIIHFYIPSKVLSNKDSIESLFESLKDIY